jgi:hypothetical protein
MKGVVKFKRIIGIISLVMLLTVDILTPITYAGDEV